MSKAIRDATVSVNGIALHYLEAGAAEAPPLLLVHGLTREAHSFDPVLAQLGGRYRCLAVDIRGRGGSDRAPAETYSIAQYTADVLALLDALALPQVAYLGTSMGGIIAMTLAAEAPQRFSRLALNDIGPEVAAEGGAKIQGHLERMPTDFETFDAALAYEVGRFPWLAHRPRTEVEAQYRHMLVRTDDGRWRFHYDPAIRHGRAVTDAARAAQAERNWRGFRALQCPLLLIRGAETDLLSEATVAQMAAAQPHLQIVNVPGVGHAPALTEPAAVAALDAFFQG